MKKPDGGSIAPAVGLFVCDNYFSSAADDGASFCIASTLSPGVMPRDSPHLDDDIAA